MYERRFQENYLCVKMCMYVYDYQNVRSYFDIQSVFFFCLLCQHHEKRRHLPEQKNPCRIQEGWNTQECRN